MENFVSKERELIIEEEEIEKVKQILEEEKNKRLLELERVSNTFNKEFGSIEAAKSYKDLLFKKNFVII